MKKITIILMILSIVLVFAACKNDKDLKTEATPTPVVTAEPTEEPTPTVEPTPEVTRVPDPEVDAVIFNFFYENDHGYTLLGDTQHCDARWVQDKGLGIFPVSEDPWVQVNPVGPNNAEVNLTEYPVFKMRVMNKTPGTAFEAFLKRAGEAFAGGDLFTGTIGADATDYVDIIINLKEIKGDAYVSENNGTVSDMRLDIVNLSPAKATVEEHAGDESIAIYVDYFGFFKTVEDAQGWVPTHVSQK